MNNKPHRPVQVAHRRPLVRYAPKRALITTVDLLRCEGVTPDGQTVHLGVDALDREVRYEITGWDPDANAFTAVRTSPSHPTYEHDPAPERSTVEPGGMVEISEERTRGMVGEYVVLAGQRYQVLAFSPTSRKYTAVPAPLESENPS